MPYICNFCGQTHRTGEICQETIPLASKFKDQEDVSRQKHYIQHEIQVIKFCEVNKLGWCASNVIKYICRYEQKSGLEDLKKAEVYLKTLIQYVESGTFKTPDELDVK